MLYNWFEVINGVKTDIPEDPNHPLAYSYGPWKIIRRPLKPQSQVGYWDNFANKIIGIEDPDLKCKKILGLA